MKKSIWVTVVVAILTAAIAVGAVFAVQAIQKRQGVSGDKHNTTCTIEYLQPEYEQGDDIVYHFVVYSDIEFTSVTYRLGTADETTIENVKNGKTKELKDVADDLGDFYSDTKVQIIDSSELKEGYYTLVFYGYDKLNNRYEINKEPFSFKLVVTETPATQVPVAETSETPAV